MAAVSRGRENGVLPFFPIYLHENMGIPEAAIPLIFHFFLYNYIVDFKQALVTFSAGNGKSALNE